jgi:DNA primase
MDPADLVQSGRAADLKEAIAQSRPLLQFRIEKEVGRQNTGEPEGRARAIRNTARLIARVSDPIAQAEYVRFAAKEIGVEPSVIGAALAGGYRAGNGAARAADTDAIDRTQSELLRVMLTNPIELAEVALDPTWFNADLFDLVTEIEKRRAGVPPGEPITLNDMPNFDLVQQLAFDSRPLPSPLDVLQRAEEKALERRIKETEHLLTTLPPGSDAYSEHLRALIGLQEQRRARGAQ